MSKFLPQKKKLIEDVFEKASNETSEKSFSGILKYLERSLFDNFKITLSYKTFENYYLQIVQNEQDYNIKALTLDDLSNYLGYDNFKTYCAEWKTVEYSAKESLSKVVINIVNKPLLKMPDFLTKNSNLGMVGILLCGTLVVGSKIYKADEPVAPAPKIKSLIRQDEPSVAEKSSVQTVVYVPQIMASLPVEKEKVSEISVKQCMFWDGREYIPMECNSSENGLIAIDIKKVKNFKKITRTDTVMSSENLWYSKHHNMVEFFTSDGVNPENGKDLRPVSDYIFEKYLQQ